MFCVVTCYIICRLGGILTYSEKSSVVSWCHCIVSLDLCKYLINLSWWISELKHVVFLSMWN